MIVTDAVYQMTAQDAAPRSGFSTAAMQQATKEVTVEFAGTTGKVWYRPWVFTPRAVRDLDKATDEGDGFDRIMRQLELLVADWEVIGRDGNRLPVTAEAMEAELPNLFLSTVLRTISEDMRPNPQSASDSSAG